MMDSFEQKFQWGRVGETAIAAWLRYLGYSVLPAYDIPLDEGKGPRLYAAFDSGHNQLVVPDILAIHPDIQKGLRWVEAKRKTHFGWYRKFEAWQTGIDARHYEHYLHVREITGLPLWLMFLHVSSIPSASDLAWGSPKECPTGLFIGEIGYLKEHISQRDGYWKNGRYYEMVYWRHTTLRCRASLEEILALHPFDDTFSESENDELPDWDAA